METGPVRRRRTESSRRRIIVQGIHLHISSGGLNRPAFTDDIFRVLCGAGSFSLARELLLRRKRHHRTPKAVCCSNHCGWRGRELLPFSSWPWEGRRSNLWCGGKVVRLRNRKGVSRLAKQFHVQDTAKSFEGSTEVSCSEFPVRCQRQGWPIAFAEHEVEPTIIEKRWTRSSNDYFRKVLRPTWIAGQKG